MLNFAFMLLNLIIGIMFVVSSGKILNVTGGKSSTAVETATRGSLIIGVILITSSLAFVYCHHRSGTSILAGNTSYAAYVYGLFIFALGITSFVLGQRITGNSDDSTVVSQGKMIMWTGVGLSVSSLAALGYHYKSNLHTVMKKAGKYIPRKQVGSQKPLFNFDDDDNDYDFGFNDDDDFASGFSPDSDDVGLESSF